MRLSTPFWSWTSDASDVAVIKLDMQDASFIVTDYEPAKWSVEFKNWIMDQALGQHNIAITKSGHPLKLWINELISRGKRVVVLVDENDKVAVDLALRDQARAEDFIIKVLKPFFEATKGVNDKRLVKIIVCGVTNLALNTVATGANHFKHAFRIIPNLAHLVGFTADEIKNTYGDKLLAALHKGSC
jgi:hypothetical protein